MPRFDEQLNQYNTSFNPTQLGQLSDTGQVSANYNPTNPNQYNYNWGSANINNYLSQDFTDPSGQNPISFLESRGINIEGLDESSLAFLPDTQKLQTAFDRMNTQVGMARTGLGFDMGAQQLAGTQNLLGMTGGMGIASGGSGFGAQNRNMFNNIGNVQNQYESGLNQSMAGFQSDVLGMQYDFQDAQSAYQDSLTTALGNIMAAGEDDFTINYTGNTYGTNASPNYLGGSVGGASNWGTGQDYGGS